MRRTIKAVAGICVLVGTLFLTSSTANAQECGGYFGPPCTEETLTFEYPRTVRAGQVIRITGLISEESTQAARASADTVSFVLADVNIGSTDVNADGTFADDFTVPNVAPAEYDITATSGTLTATGPITVIDGSGVGNTGANNNGNNVAGGTNPLARTGFDATPMVTLGAAVVILGAAAVYGSKRRRIA
ncbi:MAG TPA: cytochrome c maturation protein CcmE [Iamia sp.]